MLKSASVILLIAICSQAFYNAGVMAYWLSNRAYIASQLCIKKDEPNNCCAGKCYLTKKMTVSAKPDAQQEASAMPVLKTGLEGPFVLPELLSMVGCPSLVPKVPPVAVPFRYERLCVVAIFHPPPASKA
jgi:hypothetical protein